MTLKGAMIVIFLQAYFTEFGSFGPITSRRLRLGAQRNSSIVHDNGLQVVRLSPQQLGSCLSNDTLLSFGYFLITCTTNTLCWCSSCCSC